MIMHDTDIIAIWLCSVSAGMLLTLLITQIASAPNRRSHMYHAAPAQLTQDTSDELRGGVVQTAHDHALALVSTPSARDIPRAVRDHRARDQDQAA